MKSKSIAVLIVAAVALAGLAAVMVSKRAEKPAAPSDKLFPALQGKVNDAARVEIVKGGSTTVLVKNAEGAWAVESKGGYPAEFENIKTLIVNLAKAEIVEEKTANPENYSRIGVEDPKPAAAPPAPAQPDAAPTPEATGSTLVTVKDSGGQTLASVVLGNTPTSSGMSTEPSRFVRRAGEKQSYLAKHAPSAEPGVMTWVSREVLKIEGTRIQSVVVTSPKPLETPAVPSNGDPPSTLTTPAALPQQVIVERGAAGASDPLGKFEFKNAPAGRELKSQGQEGQIASALAYVDMEDVMPASQLGEAAVVSTADYKTKDGLTVTITLREKDGKTWGTIKADAFAVIPPAKPEEPKIPDAPSPPAAPGEKKEGETPKPEPPPAGPPVPSIDPTIAEEAKKLNDKLGAWAFAIPSWKATQFKSNWNELLKPPPTPAAPQGPAVPVPSIGDPNADKGPG